MAYMAFVTLVLLSSSTLVAPLCFGWFDDDDDQTAVPVNGTFTNTTTTAMPLLNCQALDDVFSYFNDLYDYFDQTFNPFYEAPPATTPLPPVLNTTQLNDTSTTPAPAPA